MTDAAEQIIRAAEGCSRLVIRDTRGYQTIAIGCCVDPKVKGARGLCDAAIQAQFEFDSAEASSRAAAIPGYAALSDVQKGVIESMCFQLGTLADWPQFRAALAVGDLQGCQAAGMASEWATSEERGSPVRAKWELGMLRTGVFVPYPA
jgi:GH24 family phage-related lysozyme (muramidase)